MHQLHSLENRDRHAGADGLTGLHQQASDDARQGGAYVVRAETGSADRSASPQRRQYFETQPLPLAPQANGVAVAAHPIASRTAAQHAAALLRRVAEHMFIDAPFDQRRAQAGQRDFAARSTVRHLQRANGRTPGGCGQTQSLTGIQRPVRGVAGGFIEKPGRACCAQTFETGLAGGLPAIRKSLAQKARGEHLVKSRQAEDLRQPGLVGLYALDTQAAHRQPQTLGSGGAGAADCDELGQHGVVVRRDFGAAIDAAVHAQTGQIRLGVVE